MTKNLLAAHSSSLDVLLKLEQHVPTIIAASGDRASYRFIEFFTATIRNPNTRRAYMRDVVEFCRWIEEQGVPSIAAVTSVHVAAYIEWLGKTHSAPTTKRHLAAIRSMFDWLASGGVLPFNPASAVRGPKHSVKKGKTPVLDPEEARQILDGTVKLTGVSRRHEQWRRRLQHPREPRSIGLSRRLVREALSKIAVENGGPNLKQKMGAPL